MCVSVSEGKRKSQKVICSMRWLAMKIMNKRKTRKMMTKTSSDHMRKLVIISSELYWLLCYTYSVL